MAPREELPGQVKAFIIQALARFDTPTRVVGLVKEAFDLELTRQRVHYYDPTSKSGTALPEELKTLFFETREKFLKDPSGSPIANPNYRLAVLQRSLETAEKRGQLTEVRAALEQAAKEIGGGYTNKLKHEHAGPDGKPLPAPTAAVTIYQLPDNGRGAAGDHHHPAAAGTSGAVPIDAG